MPLAWERHLLSYSLNLVEKEVNPPTRMGKSDVGRKSHLCDCPEGKKNMAHVGNCRYFTAAGAKSGEIRYGKGGTVIGECS